MMSIYESLMLMINFGMLVIAVLKSNNIDK
ncbi:putative holin-like toxin [Scopulibacillus cellulosilyticus]|uniref:Holin-like toxin n=1 Tax=Scopulibacillus cellulosilyticus TaxID=2665665 RepID=A0ABW2PZQ4_9BACL